MRLREYVDLQDRFKKKFNLGPEVGALGVAIPAIQAAQAYDPIAESANSLLQAELEKFDNQEISRKTFLKRTKNILADAYQKAYVKGAGITKISSDGQDWIKAFAKKQNKYLDKFAADIEAGEGTMDYDNRMELYANAVRAAYWGGSSNEADDDEPMDWVTTAHESCEDCLAREANSPYTRGTLPGVPGDGSTQCRTNCKCLIVKAR